MMNFKVSHLLLVVSLCYVSADLKASGIEKAKESGTEDVGVRVKEQPQKTEALLQGDAGASASSTEPPAPSTTQPTPAEDNKGDWKLYYNASTVIFARIAGEIKLKVSYPKSANETGEQEVFVPKTAITRGNCTVETCTNSTMTLSWLTNGTKRNDSLNFVYNLNTAKRVWQVVSIFGNITVPIPKTNKTHLYIPLYFYMNDTGFFNAHVGMSYMCLRSNSYDVTFNQTSHNGYNFTSAALLLSQFQIEAFKPNNSNNNIFGSPNNCETTPDMVPIAVGCALAGLVVIVLVAYLIAQRKPPAQGYRSV